MELIVFLIVAFVGAGISAVLMNLSTANRRKSAKEEMHSLREDSEVKAQAKERLEELYEQMIDVGTLRKKAEEYLSYQDSLKAERGRSTITQAELETVDGRLRELEEIERELEACNLETKEEISILEKKKNDLSNKNSTLQSKIQESTGKLEAVLSEIELNAQMQEQVDNMKMQLLQTQEKIDNTLSQIEQGNDQYFILKKRYDALDIEYAQLYEKFSAAED